MSVQLDRFLRNFLVAAPFCALVVFCRGSAMAQVGGGVVNGNGDGLDTHLFRPALDSKGFFHTNGTSVIGHQDVSFGLVLDYGNGLLRVPDVGQSNTALVQRSLQGTLHVNYGLFNRAIVGLSLPVNLMTSGAQTNAQGGPLQPGWSPQELDSQTVGAPAIHAKVKILAVEQGVGLAASLQAGVTVTDAPGKAGADPSFYVWPQLIADKRFGSTGWLRLGANIGLRAHPMSSTQLELAEGTLRDGQRLTYSLGLAARVADPLELVVDSYATYLLSDSAAANKPSNEVSGGIKLYIDQNSYLLVGGGTRYTLGFEAANVRAFLGFIFEPSIGDRDGDGIKDDVDRCPDVPEDRDGVEDDDGCPEADQIRRNIPDSDGEPNAFSKCPEGQELSEAGLCAVPAPPPKGDVIVGEGGLVLFKKIKFKTDSAEILPESNGLLDSIASVIRAHSEILLMEVAGHADERAPDQYNLLLTQRRVDSVVSALVKRDIAKERLRSKGYGEFCPEDEEHTEEAWEKNRRVEFKIVKSADGGPPPQLGCANAVKKGVKPDPIP
jgi:OmpA-OmpF porin, OOP family